jgi:hypothetical protein
MDVDGFSIYLSSLGNSIEHSSNKANSFTNEIHPILNLQEEYEVTLQNYFFKPEFYSIIKNDELFQITLYFIYFLKGATVKLSGHVYIPTENIYGANVEECIQNLEYDMREYFHKKQLIEKEEVWHRNGGIFIFQKNIGRIVFPSLIPRSIEKEYDKVQLIWKFSKLAMLFFGLKYSQESITISHTDSITAAFPPNIYPQLDYIYVYTDIVETSHVGGKQVNLLDIIPIRNISHKNITINSYKRVKFSNINSISISLNDQNGRKIPFIDGCNTVCILHFKPKN